MKAIVDCKPKFQIPADITFKRQSCWCGTAAMDSLYNHDRWGQALQTAVCVKCGTIRLEPRITKEQAVYYYTHLYPETQYNVHDWFEEQSKRSAPNCLRKFLNPDMRILDYGCEPGGKLADLIPRGYRVYGHDVNATYLTFALLQGLRSFEPGLNFDCIFFSHTIKHWTEPFRDLSELLETNLLDLGTVIVEVPLIDRLLLGGRINGIQGDVYLPHIWYFSLRSLDKLMMQLRCKRVFTNRVTVCVYQYSQSMLVPELESTTLQDFMLRKMIRICSLPAISRIMSRLNHFIRYIDVYNQPPFN